MKSFQRMRDNASWRQDLGWGFFALLICVHFTLVYGAVPNFLNLALYARGMERLPYQTRVLMLPVFRVLAEGHWVEAVAQHAPRQFRNPYQVVEMGIVLLSLAGTVLTTRTTLVRLTGDREFSRWFSLAIVYMAYFDLAPGWGLVYSLPYDVPGLFFFSLGVYLVLRGNTWGLYAVLPFADLNRETACFLTAFFLIWQWCIVPRVRVGWLVAHGLAQMAIWAALRMYVNQLFAGNPTDGAPSMGMALFSLKLAFNIRAFFEPQQWPVLLSTFGFLLPALWMGRRWIQSPGIYWACAILVPLWFLGMTLVGIVIEIRVFSELSAVLVPALGLIVHNRFVLSRSDQCTS